MDLKSIILSITPENLKKIPLLDVSINIFVDTINQTNEIAQRITALFEVEESQNDSEMIKRSKAILREGLYLTWIYSLYTSLKRLCGDPEIMKDIDKFNYTDSALKHGLSNLINPQFLSTNRTFSQKVGTEQAIRYIYYFGKYLETGSYENDLEVFEKNPFILEYEGSMGKRMFRSTVKPMAHPIGWIDTYTQVIKLVFQCFFGIEIFKTYSKIELQNIEKAVVFISDDNIDSVYEDFQKRINPLTKRPYTVSDIDELVQIFNGKISQSFTQTLNPDGSMDTTIVFSDQTVLCHFGQSPKKTFFSTYDDYLNDFKEPLMYWDENWDFYGDLSANFRFLYYDTIDEWEKILHITRIKEENGGRVGNSVYITDYFDNCFKVGGEVYPYTFGCDEHQFVCDNSEEVNTEVLAKFNLNSSYKLFKDSKIRIEDDHGNYRDFEFKAGTGNFSINTFSMQGFNYTVYVDEIAGIKYWYKTKGLNTFDAKIKFTKVFTENYILRIIGSCILDDDQYLDLIITDSSGTKHNFKTTEHDFEFDLDVNKLPQGQFRIDCFIKDSKKKIYYKHFYEGCDLKLYNDIEPQISFLNYGEKPTFRFDKRPLEHISLLKGFYSKADYVRVRIGELQDGSFAPQDEKVIDYMEGYSDPFNNPKLNDKILRGSLIEGSIYEKSFYYDLPEEETFIYKGYEHFEIDTSDFIIMDSSRFVSDDFEIIQLSQNYYLYTLPDTENVGGRYLVSSDGLYLYTNESNSKVKFYDGDNLIKTDVIENYTMWENVKETIRTPKSNNFLYWSLKPKGSKIDDSYVFENDQNVYAVYLDDVDHIKINYKIS